MHPKRCITRIIMGDNFDYWAFKTAFYFAENGLPVWVISPSTFSKVPNNIKPPEKEVLQLITFMYLKDYKDLVSHLNGVHLWERPPRVIMIIGFGEYCDFLSETYNPMQAALVSASLEDCAAVCSTKQDKETFLLLTCVEPADDNKKGRLKRIRDLYFPHVLKGCHDELFKHITALLN